MCYNLPFLVLVAHMFVSPNLKFVAFFTKVQGLGVVLAHSKFSPSVVLFHVPNLRWTVPVHSEFDFVAIGVAGGGDDQIGSVSKADLY